MLDEEVILTWYQKGLSSFISLVDLNLSSRVRKNAIKFVNWIQNAEEDDE